MANKPSPDRLSYLFKRYLDKSYTPEEYEELMQYISESANDQQLRTLIDEGWQYPLPEYEQDAARANTIFNTIIEQPALRPSRSGRLRSMATYMTAAVLLLTIGAGLYYYYTKPASERGPVVQQTPNSPAPTDHRYIRLPDGSTVLLNVGSQLQYPDSFGSTRVVHLTGEGYFDIRHDAGKPFIVMAGNTRTVVLGTAFDIKAFPGQANVVVTVTRGKVRVEKDNKTIGVLTPNEQLVVNENNSSPVKEIVNTSTAIAWKQDDILLDDVPLREAAQELEQRFHCSITFNKPALENCHVTASFLHHETLNQIIQVVARINSMNYRFENDSTIMLSGEGCPD
jgi:ferric-dicitrate binding protein FerR (iron transport regulator)